MTTLSSLPGIAAQLIAHCLPLRSILQLARCCRCLQSSLDSAFTFKHAAPLWLDYHDPLCIAAVPLRHARIAVRWFLHPAAIEATQRDVQGLLDSPIIIHSLDASRCQHVPVPLLTSLLSNPRIKSSLRELVLQRGHKPTSIKIDLVRAICALPHLQSLKLGQCRGPLKDWSDVPAPPSLTSLTFFPGDAAMFLLPFLRSTTLKHLHLKRASIASLLSQLIPASSPLLFARSIETLIIDDCRDSLTLPLVLPFLPALTALHLRRCPFVDAMLEGCVRRCKALRSIIIEPGYRIADQRETRRRLNPMDWDSTSRFHVLNEFPLLQITIRLRAYEAPNSAITLAWVAQQGLHKPTQLQFDASEPVLPRSDPRVGKTPRYDTRFPRKASPPANPEQDNQSPLLRSSDDVLRLVMQRLDAKGLLQFARCSRRLLYLADVPFVWQCSPLHLTAESFSRYAPSRLARHIPLHLSWTKHETFAYYGRVERTLRRHPLMNLVSVYQIGCRGMNTLNGEYDRKRQWSRFLQQPAVQRLQRLVTDETCDRELLGIMRGLPCLTSLTLELARPERDAGLSYLCSFPALQSLCLRSHPNCRFGYRCVCKLEDKLRTTQTPVSLLVRAH